MADQAPKIVIIDDDASVRRSLERLLRAAGYQTESYISAESFLENGLLYELGCIILDIRMKGLTGLELHERLCDNGFDIPIIFLTGHGDVPMSVKAIKQGALDFLTKPVDDETLLSAIQQALTSHDQRIAHHNKLETIRQCAATLTEREREVMQFVIAGALNKQIAFELGIVEKTVKVHRGHVMEKMRVHSVAELVHICALLGIEPKNLS